MGSCVMAGLVPAIHLVCQIKAWVAGPSPAMTRGRGMRAAAKAEAGRRRSTCSDNGPLRQS